MKSIALGSILCGALAVGFATGFAGTGCSAGPIGGPGRCKILDSLVDNRSNGQGYVSTGTSILTCKSDPKVEVSIMCSSSGDLVVTSGSCPNADAGIDASVDAASDSGMEGGPNSGIGYAYVAAGPGAGGSAGPGVTLMYKIQSDGSLSALSPASVAAGAGPQRVAVRGGSVRNAYVTNFDDNTVSQYAIGAGGVLSPLSPAAVTTGGSQSLSVAVASAGNALFVTTSTGVSTFTVGATGTLTPRGSVPATAPHDLCASGDKLYVANAGIGVGTSQFAVSGANLTPLAPASVGMIGQAAIACSSTNVYTAAGDVNASNQVLQYSVAANGLSPLDPASVPLPDIALASAFDPVGKHLFVIDIGGSVALFTVDATGKLSAMTPPTLVPSVPLAGGAFDPSGKFFYGINSADKKILVYAVGATDITPIANLTVTLAGDTVPLSMTTVAP